MNVSAWLFVGGGGQLLTVTQPSMKAVHFKL